jgi:hypothetical protein
MRRVLILVPALLLLAVVIVSVSRGDSGGGRSAADSAPSADVMPYPRTTKPLPVPEIHVRERPWTDPLPGVEAPTQVPRPRLAPGIPGCVDEGEFRVCRSG